MGLLYSVDFPVSVHLL